MDITGAKRVAQFRDSLERATGFDSWGQVVEAVDEYEKLAKSIKKALDDVQQVRFTDDQAKFVGKVATVATLRAAAAQDLTGDTGLLTLDNVRKVLGMLSELPNQKTPPPFPFQVQGLRRTYQPQAENKPSQPTQAHDSEDEETNDTSTPAGGTLKPRKTFPGKTSLTFRIEKIKLKDPGQYIEPYFTVSFKDKDGRDITPPMDTPHTNTRSEFIQFGCDVHMQVPVEQLPVDGAVFFEFKHYKPKKQKISTKCYSFMEQDELKNGTHPLEIYAKPTDFRRKKYTLLTEKAHYLYVTITLNED